MSDYTKLFERAGARYEPPDLKVEELLKRHDCKRRKQRIEAGVLGFAIAIAVGLLGFNAIRSSPHVPANDTPIPTPSPTGQVVGIDWESLPGVSIDDDAIIDIQTGEITSPPASIASLHPAQGYALSPGGDVLLFEASTRRSTRNPFTGCGGLGGAPPFRACQIFVANVDGTNVRQLTDVPGGANAGDWSPDGTRVVAIVASGEGRLIDLVLVDVATGETTQLVSGPAGDFQRPHFSPDGQRILFSRFTNHGGPRDEDPAWDLFQIPEGGGDVSLVLEDRGHATFSPGGGTMVFTGFYTIEFQGGATSGPELWLADADGSDPRPVVSDEPFSDYPSWSSDGTRFLYSRLAHEEGYGVVVFDMASGTPTYFVRTPSVATGIWLDDDTLLIQVHAR